MKITSLRILIKHKYLVTYRRGHFDVMNSEQSNLKNLFYYFLSDLNQIKGKRNDKNHSSTHLSPISVQ